MRSTHRVKRSDSVAKQKRQLNPIKTLSGPQTQSSSTAAGLRGYTNSITSTPKTAAQLQQRIGNRALGGLLAGMTQSDDEKKSDELIKESSIGGLKRATDHEFVGGRTVGEFFGDVARPVATGVGNVIGSVAGAATGIRISSMTNVGPTWNNHGAFSWRVGFNTSASNGWIVQKIDNTYRAQNSAGNNLGGVRPTPRYWEAWSVDGAGNVRPNVGATNDMWLRPNRGNNTQGHWSMTGAVYFTKTNPATQGFAPGNVADAGILMSARSAPIGLGIARLRRYAHGTWDSTGAVPSHAGSAGP